MTQGAKRRPGRARLGTGGLHRLSIIASLALLAAGCGQKPVATVNGEPITRDEFYQTVLNTPSGGQPNMALGIQVLEGIINERLLLAEAKREGVLPTDAEITNRLNELRTQVQKQGSNLDQQLQQSGLSPEAVRRDIRRLLIQEKLLTKGITVTDAEVQKYYDQNKARQFSAPPLAHIRHMTLANEKQAIEARKDLKNADFGLVAMSRSIDMFKETQGQVQQPIPRDLPPGMRIAPEVARKAFTMKKGQISDPIKVGNQWVIIKLEELDPAKTQPLAEVKEDIRRGLLQQKAQQSGQASRVSARLTQLRQQADIGINIDQYKNAAIFKQQPAAGGIPGMPPGAELPPGAAPPTEPTGGAPVGKSVPDAGAAPGGTPPAGATAPPTTTPPPSGK
jgi:foldase protein PrsA